MAQKPSNDSKNDAGTRTLSIDGTIGAFVWWDAEDLTVEPGKLREILTDNGFDEVAARVPDIEPSSAIRRAAQEWGQGRGNQDRYKAEVNVEDGNQVVVGILHRWQNGDKSGWNQIETVVFDKASGTWASDAAADTDQCVAFTRVAADRMQYLDARWIRPRFIMDQLDKASAIRLRNRGGFYFIADSQLPLVDRMSAVLNAMGPNCMSIARIQGDEGSRKAVANGVRESMQEALAEIGTELDGWQSQSRKVRTDSQTNIFGSLQTLLARASLFEQTLEIQLTDLRDKVQEAQDRAMAILAGAAK